MALDFAALFWGVSSAGAAFRALPAPVQKAVITASVSVAKKLAGQSGSWFWRRLTVRLGWSCRIREQRAALADAIATVLVGRAEADAIAFAAALTRSPFSDLILGVFDTPDVPVDDTAVRAAFEASTFGAQTLGIDPARLVRQLQDTLLEKLRQRDSTEAHVLFMGTRLAQVHATQREQLAGQARIEARLDELAHPSTALTVSTHATVSATGQIAPAADSDPKSRWDQDVARARELHLAGALRAALALWERLATEVTQAPADPALRARIHNNLGDALLGLDRADKAVEAFRRAVEYEPEDPRYLGNLAQAELITGDRTAALRTAARLEQVAPASATPWSVRAQAAPRPADDLAFEASLPEALRHDPEVLVGRAVSVQATDTARAVSLLRAALRTGRRDAQELILLAETLHAGLYPRLSIAGPPPADVVEEIARLGAEATEALRVTDRLRLRIRALWMQAAAARLAGAPDKGASYLDEAAELDPANADAKILAARAHTDAAEGADGGAAALYLLDRVAEGERGAAWHVTRIRALGAAGRTEDVDDDVRAALVSLRDDPSQPEDLLPDLANAVFATDRPDLADEVLDLLDDWAQRDAAWAGSSAAMRALYRARVAAAQGDHSAAESAFERGLAAAADESHRAGVAMEYAQYLDERGELARACDQYAASALWQTHDELARRYALAAMRGARWKDAAAIVAHYHGLSAPDGNGAEPEAPAVWVLEVEAALAEARNDPTAARSALDALLVHRPDVARWRLRLAMALDRLGDGAAAAATLAPLEERRDLDPYDAINLAVLLMRHGRPAPALKHAFRAMRAAHDDAAVQHTGVVQVFMALAETQVTLPPELLSRAVVVPDTWVRLRSTGGEEVRVLVLADGEADARRGEVLASNPRAAWLLGRRVGDRVVRRAGEVNEERFEVVELKSAILHTFHDAMESYQDRFSGTEGARALQSIHVGEGESFDPTAVVRMVAQGAAGARLALEFYREKRIPLGVLAELLGQPLGRTYVSLLNDARESVFVRDPTTPSHHLNTILGGAATGGDAREAGEASATPAVDRAADIQASPATVVLTETALQTLYALGRLDLLIVVGEAIPIQWVAPRALVDDLDAEIAYCRTAHERGPRATAYMTDDHRLAVTEVRPEAFDQALERATAIREVARVARILPRPLEQGRDGWRPNAREVFGRASYDALELTSTARPIYADDFGLLRAAAEGFGATGFSTYDLLEAAEDHGVIGTDDWQRLVAALVRMGQSFVPVNADQLFRAFVDDGYIVTPSMARLLNALSEPATLDTAVHVGVALLRQVALSPLGHGALEALTMAVVEPLGRGRSPLVVGRQFAAVAAAAFRLLPRAHRLVTDRLTVYLAARG
jgi:transcription elongation GreA/GreB family factor